MPEDSSDTGPGDRCLLRMSASQSPKVAWKLFAFITGLIAIRSLSEIMNIQPITQIKFPIRIWNLRPILSIKLPASREPSAAPTVSNEPNHEIDWSVRVIFGSFFILSIAPDE